MSSTKQGPRSSPVQGALQGEGRMVLPNVIIRITEGPQFNFGHLTIEGLDLNAEAAMKKLWGLKEGKPFDTDYPDFFLGRVREDGYFENLHNTKAVVKVDEPTRVVDVTLQFK